MVLSTKVLSEPIKRLVQMFNYQQFFFRFQYVIIDDIDRQSVTKQDVLDRRVNFIETRAPMLVKERPGKLIALRVRDIRRVKNACQESREIGATQ